MSITISGLIITVISFVVSRYGLPFTEAEINSVVIGLAEVIGIAIAWYGRYRQGDITALGTKK